MASYSAAARARAAVPSPAVGASEREEIHLENQAAVAAMSPEEIADARAELLARLPAPALAMIRRRAAVAGRGSEGAPPPTAIPGDGVSTTLGQRPSVDAAGFKSPTSHLGAKKPAAPEEEAVEEEAMEDNDGGVAAQWVGCVERVRQLRFSLAGEPMGADAAADVEQALGLDALPPPLPGHTTTFPRLNATNMSLTCWFHGADGSDPAAAISERLAVERDLLRADGDPARGGYSLKEATILSRSSVAGQRAAGLKLISAVLLRATTSLMQGGSAGGLPLTGGSAKGCGASVPSEAAARSANWPAIWAYTTGPQLQLTVILRDICDFLVDRMALDDNSATVQLGAVHALHALLCCAANEAYFDKLECQWRGEEVVATCPIFRRRKASAREYSGGGRWKDNVKPEEFAPALGVAAETEVEAKKGVDTDAARTVASDADVASRDVVAGLIRMGVLPRIRYLLEVVQLPAADQPLIEILIAIARHSEAAAAAVLDCPHLIDALQAGFLRASISLVTSATAITIKLLKVLCQASAACAAQLATSGLLHLAVCHLLQQSPLSLAPGVSGHAVVLAPSPAQQLSVAVEGLRLWRVCLRYHFGRADLSDLYPQLCLWATASDAGPPASVLAREAYLALEALSPGLFRLRHLPQRRADPSSGVAVGHLSWQMVLALVDGALDWLVPNAVTAAAGGGSGGLAAMASVVHFLATVCALGLPEGASQDEGLGTDKAGGHDSGGAWLPPFLGEVRERLVASGLQDGAPLQTLLAASAQSGDGELALAATGCVHGVHRLAVALPLLQGHADLSERLLRAFGSALLEHRARLSACTAGSRGGPAPGPGVGWGRRQSGDPQYWSLPTAVLQAKARIAADLLEATGQQSEPEPATGGSMSYCDSPDRQGSKDGGAVRHFRFKVGLAVAGLAGPGDSALLARVLLSAVLDERALGDLLEQLATHMSLDGAGGATSALAALPARLRRLLLPHYVTEWLSVKERPQRAAVTEAGDVRPGGLAPVPEAEDEHGTEAEAAPGRLAETWVGQRLPLPEHWLLSALAVPRGADGGAAAADVVEAGLVLALCTLEAGWPEGSLVFSRPQVLHGLSQAFVASDGVVAGDLARSAVRALQDWCGRQLHAGVCFGRSYAMVAEQLANHFSDTSYGDRLYGRQVAALLAPPVACAEVRLATWQALANSGSLALLPDLADCFFPPDSYLSLPQESAAMLDLYVSAFTSGAWNRACSNAPSMTHALALHYVCIFLFQDWPSINSEDAAKRVTVISRLLRATASQNAVLQLVSYNPPHGQLQLLPDVERIRLLDNACISSPDIASNLAKLRPSLEFSGS
eukprot:SM000124S25918  [mRNA]  locus=s124:145953:151736:+ [translate_table: standard]